jgi:hypothetical protein
MTISKFANRKVLIPAAIVAVAVRLTPAKIAHYIAYLENE